MSDFPAEGGDGFGGVVITSVDPRLSIGGFCVATGIVNIVTWNGSAWPVANKAVYVPFLVPRPITAVKMFWINGPTVSGNVDVGIFDTAGNRLVSSGSTAQAGTSAMQVVDITDTPLNPGRYYMGMAMNNATGLISALLSGVTGAAAFYNASGMLQQATAFPLPNPATFAATSSAYIPAFGLTARVLV